MDSERSHKEQRIREITFLYYSRADVKKTLFDFSKNRECIPRYYEAFGKRPDIFQYESDILEHVKKVISLILCSLCDLSESILNYYYYILNSHLLLRIIIFKSRLG